MKRRKRRKNNNVHRDNSNNSNSKWNGVYNKDNNCIDNKKSVLVSLT